MDIRATDIGRQAGRLSKKSSHYLEARLKEPLLGHELGRGLSALHRGVAKVQQLQGEQRKEGRKEGRGCKKARGSNKRATEIEKFERQDPTTEDRQQRKNRIFFFWRGKQTKKQHAPCRICCRGARRRRPSRAGASPPSGRCPSCTRASSGATRSSRAATRRPSGAFIHSFQKFNPYVPQGREAEQEPFGEAFCFPIDEDGKDLQQQTRELADGLSDRPTS